MIMETRQQWGGKPPRNRRYDVTPEGVAIHWPGARTDFRARPHEHHQRFMRQWQEMHMEDQGQNDIGYGSVLCPCGILMMGRTEPDKPLVRVGSNGTADANRRYTSVQMMLGTQEPPTDLEITWLGEAVAWLRSKGWGPAVVGHRDLSQTSCPGDALYAALPRIRAAADRAAGGSRPQPAPSPIPEPEHEEGDTTMYVVRSVAGAAYIVDGPRATGLYTSDIVDQLRKQGVVVLDNLTDPDFKAQLAGRTVHRAPGRSAAD